MSTKKVATVVIGSALVLVLSFVFVTPMSYTHAGTVAQSEKSGMYNCLVGMARINSPQYAVVYCDSLSEEKLQEISETVWESYINRGK